LLKIASAMIDRAELPVHRKSTLYGSAMARLTNNRTRGQAQQPSGRARNMISHARLAQLVRLIRRRS
jgi:hypothetical protein